MLDSSKLTKKNEVTVVAIILKIINHYSSTPPSNFNSMNPVIEVDILKYADDTDVFTDSTET